MIERKNPIPPGRYWLNFKNPSMDGGRQADAFTAWARGPAVQILSTEDGDPELMTFVIFRVLTPVPRWPDSAGLGLPTVAPPNVKSSGDTVQRPDVRGIGDLIEEVATKPDEIVGAIGEGVSTALKVVFAGAMAYFIVDLLINRRKSK